MNKCTPGPWEIDGPMTGPRCAKTYQIEGTFITGARYKDSPSASPVVCVIPETEESAVGDEQYRKGDAQLIAAAPDMYEALKYARRFMKKEDVDVEYIDKAIAKAEGTAQQEEKDE